MRIVHIIVLKILSVQSFWNISSFFLSCSAETQKIFSHFACSSFARVEFLFFWVFNWKMVPHFDNALLPGFACHWIRPDRSQRLLKPKLDIGALDHRNVFRKFSQHFITLGPINADRHRTYYAWRLDIGFPIYCFRFFLRLLFPVYGWLPLQDLTGPSFGFD